MTASTRASGRAVAARPSPRERAAEARRSMRQARGDSGVRLLLAVLAGMAYAGALALTLTSPQPDIWRALGYTAVLVVVTVPIVRRIAEHDGMPAIHGLFLSALVLKLAGGLTRYAVTFELYDGISDAGRYHNAGIPLAEQFRSFNFDLGEAGLIGTRFIEVLTGAVYAVTGPSRVAGYLVFSWLGFWGLVWFYRAFRTAVPDGNHRMYAYLVLFLPSLVFWPSSVGKEAWMVSTLGLAAYGAARYFVGQRGGLPRLALGLWGAAMVRPHVVLLLLAGLAIAVVFRPRLRTGRTSDALAPILRIVVVVAIAVGFVAAMGRSEERFEVGEVRRADSLGGVRDYANEKTQQGGSSFDAQPVRTPLDFPMGLVSVLYRPFPHEANNAQMTLSAIEGAALLVLTASRWRVITNAARSWRRLPYVAMAGVFIIGFVWGFSSFGNFGILVRQRVQVYPFVLAVLCAPLPGLGEHRRMRRAEIVARREAVAQGRPARPSRPALTRG